MFDILRFFDDLIWSYLGLVFILFAGFYLTVKSKAFQITILFKLKSSIKQLIDANKLSTMGVNPLKLYFASVGGMVGLGNLVAVMATVTIGGPGSLVWMWLAAFLGTVVKYSEIYLGIRYRENDGHTYHGGPMYYLRVAFKDNPLLARLFPALSAIFLCIYGVEVSQFLVITDTLIETIQIERYLAIALLLALMLVSTLGGVRTLANICTSLMPIFLLSYLLLALYIIIDNSAQMPSIFRLILNDACTGGAVAGGISAAGIIKAMHYGMARAVYSGDIGIGYDSIIQSETRANDPRVQARLAIVSLFTDTLICTISCLIIMVTGVWKQDLPMSGYIKKALSFYITNGLVLDIYILFIFFVAGFTTLIGYFVVGQKCAFFLNPKYGKKLYMLYAIFSFIFFSFYAQNEVMLVMSVSGGVLMLINIIGILKLRKEIKFE